MICWRESGQLYRLKPGPWKILSKIPNAKYQWPNHTRQRLPMVLGSWFLVLGLWSPKLKIKKRIACPCCWASCPLEAEVEGPVLVATGGDSKGVPCDVFGFVWIAKGLVSGWDLKVDL